MRTPCDGRVTVALRTAWLAALTLAVSGCYLSHERGEPGPGGGSCVGVEDWRHEVPGANFQDAITREGQSRVFGVVEGDAHGLWTFGRGGEVRRSGPIGESRSGAIAALADGFAIAGRQRRSWRLSRYDESRAQTGQLEVAVDSEESFVTTVSNTPDAVFAVGTVSTSSSGNDVLVVRATADAVEWSRTYGDGERRSEERTIGAYVDGEGRLVVLSQRWLEGSGGPYWIFALDDDGAVAWERESDEAFARDSSWSFVPLDDGVLLVGNPQRPAGARAPALAMRLDERGETRWRTELDVDASGRQSIVNDALRSDAGFVLVGYAAERAAGMIWGLRDDGSVAFERAPELPREGTATLFTQVVGFGGGYLVGGDRQWDGPTSWLFVRTDAEGNTGWVLEPDYEGRAMAPSELIETDRQSALAVGTTFPGEGRDRAGLALHLSERCEP